MRKIISSLLLTAFFFISLLNFSVMAQEGGIAPGETAATNPKERDLSVTATVPSQAAPPVPILISPENNSILTSGVVTFVWRAVTGHTVGIDRYELYINGERRFGDISTSPESNSDYVLTFDGTNYSLTLRPDRYLPDGVYTWRIRVIDVNERGTDSSTWTFTVDSTPPPLIITEIDGEDVLISATDPSSVPSEPIEVGRQPVIIGRSEAGATIQLTVTLPDGTTRQYQVTADINGVFGFHLESLPANQIVGLRFVAIDLAGLTTVLDGLRLVYRPVVIIIPIPPIIPGLPPVIEIPIEPPTIPPIFPEPFPPFFPQPSAPPGPVRVIEVPIFDFVPWLALIFAGLLLYILTLFYITGGALGFLPAFVWSLWRFFFLPWLKQRHELREQDKQKLLPWTGFSLIWMDERRQVHSQRIVTDFNGQWQIPFKTEVMYQVVHHSRCFEYPADRVAISEIRPHNAPRHLYLTGESFWLFAPQKANQVTTTEYFAISQAIAFMFVVWVRRWQPGLAKFWLFVPRLFLFTALAASAWVMIHVPFLWSGALFVLIAWLVLRDLFARVPRSLEVYVA